MVDITSMGGFYKALNDGLQTIVTPPLKILGMPLENPVIITFPSGVHDGG